MPPFYELQEQRLLAQRRKQNLDLIKRMRNGDSLLSFDSHASWYPVRPIIKKDQRALEKLYGIKKKPVK